jgi:hypothetical protein
MSDNVRTDFPTMGEHPLEGSVVNLSGARSPYTKLVPGKMGKNAGPDSTTSVARQTMVTSETNGPLCAPQTTVAYPNAPESGQTQRNVQLMPSKAGTSDFWARRADRGKI